ncbi:MAG TPA: hypothetical protein VMO78_05760 [Rhizomicrobium sp.]|nr:hypothetical protein [Rhizomicrobium sp.]
MRVLTPTIYAMVFLIVPAFAQSPLQRLNSPAIIGTIRSFDGNSISLALTDGTSMTAQVTPGARITINVKKTLADIKPGDFIASGGTMGPDGRLHANEIRIFSAPGGEGQFPMAQPGMIMTNATVKQVMTDATVKQVDGTGSAPMIRLTFHGAGAPGAQSCTGRAADAPGGPGKGCIGETKFDVPPNTPIVAQEPGDASALKLGVKVSVNVLKADDGTTTAVRIAVMP